MFFFCDSIGEYTCTHMYNCIKYIFVSKKTNGTYQMNITRERKVVEVK